MSYVDLDNRLELSCLYRLDLIFSYCKTSFVSLSSSFSTEWNVVFRNPRSVYIFVFSDNFKLKNLVELPTNQSSLKCDNIIGLSNSNDILIHFQTKPRALVHSLVAGEVRKFPCVLSHHYPVLNISQNNSFSGINMRIVSHCPNAL